MLKLNKNFSGARLFIFSIIFTALFALSLTFIVPLPQSINPPLSTVVKYSDGSIARVYLARDQQWRIYKKTDSLNKHLLESILEKEDRFFYYHPGVNPIALLKAFYRFIKNGRVINGGSTITMQLARIIEPKPRTFFSKFLEILRAFQYEIRFSKKEILQMYLNYAPFGGNIVGFETASLYYFSKPTEELKLAEAATLANLPQIPGVDFFENKELLLQKRNFLLRRLEKKNKISSKEFEKAFNSTIDIGKNSFPMDIPHVSDYFYLKGRGKSYQTTIDRGLQKFVEAKIENYRKSLENKGITNASVVLLENNGGKVLAAAGSVDYFNSPQGQVRGFKAPRQTGSTLKPFLYALALEKGIITPRTMLKDVPVSYSDFEPYNFDKKFRGLVTAEEALSHSYNVPFVRLLQSTGKDNFLEFLKDGGVSSLKENSHYGLSVILGACDINLLEISNLYRMLADGGMYSPYYISKGEIVSEGGPLISRGASYLVSKALSRRNNPDIPKDFHDRPYLNRLSWKTGTSQNYKDAWTIGYGRKYTLGVWVGNFNSKANANIVGLAAASPLFFEILGNLEEKFDYQRPRIPSDLIKVRVCPLSGKIPSPDCPESVDTYTLQNNSFMQRCRVHRRYIVEEKSGMRVMNSFEGMGRLKSEVYVVYPPQVRKYLKDRYVISDSAPLFHPESTKSSNQSEVRIMSPRDGSVYYSMSGNRLPLRADSSMGEGYIYWFLNGKFYLKTNINSMGFGNFSRGQHTLEAINESGAWDKISFHVVQ